MYPRTFVHPLSGSVSYGGHNIADACRKFRPKRLANGNQTHSSTISISACSPETQLFCRLLQRVYGPIPPLTGIPIHLLLNRSQTVKKFVHTTKLPQLPVSQLWVIITAAAPTSSTTTTTSTPNPTNSTSSLHVHEHSRIVGRQEDPRSSKLVLHQQVPPSWRSFVPSSSTY